MADELEVIRNQMDQTRAALSDKLEMLESQVRGTVQGATETVSSTVETVQDTVQSVKETFDLSTQVDKNPWMVLGGAFAIGFAGGWLLGPTEDTESRGRQQAPPAPPTPTPQPSASTESSVTGAVSDAVSGAVSQLNDYVGDGLNKGAEMIQGLAVGTLMGLVRDLVVQAVPSNMFEDAARMVDQFTTRLGGKPLGRSQPKSDQSSEHQASTQGSSHQEHGSSHSGQSQFEQTQRGSSETSEGDRSSGQSRRKGQKVAGRT